MKLKEKLSLLRKRHGMTQMDLAERLNISRQAVSRWERGTAEPSTGNLVSIGKLFGVPVNALVNKDAPLPGGPSAQVAVAERETDGGKNDNGATRSVRLLIAFCLSRMNMKRSLFCSLGMRRKAPALTLAVLLAVSGCTGASDGVERIPVRENIYTFADGESVSTSWIRRPV